MQTNPTPLSQQMYDAYVARWLHKHFKDENPWTYDAFHLGWCQTCKDNLIVAVQEGRACSAHPDAYCEPKDGEFPAWCEGCDPERSILNKAVGL